MTLSVTQLNSSQVQEVLCNQLSIYIWIDVPCRIVFTWVTLSPADRNPWQCRRHMLPVNAMHAGGHPYQGKDAVVFQWTAQSTYSQHQSTSVNIQSTHSQHKSVFCRKLWFFVHKRAWCYAIKTYFIDLNKVIRVVQILTPFLKKTKGSLWKAWLCWLCVDCMLTVCWLYVDCMLTVRWWHVDHIF